MTQQEQQLLKLRQRVDRDSDLTKGARVLFGEIVNLHVLGDGCFKEYTTLADDLGMSPRTVRRRRKELSEAGYLKVEDSGGRRHLIPTAPDTDDCTGQQCPDTSDQPDSNDRTQVSAPDTDDNGAPDSSDDHRDNILPAEAGESAPAREESLQSQPTTTEELFEALVDVWRSVSSAPPMTRKREDALWGWAEDRTVVDPDLFREVLEEQVSDTTAKGSGLSMGILLRVYKRRRDSGKLSPERQEDPDWTIDDKGRKCYMGVPIEDLGCQNLAADLQGDGHPGPDPEVSAHE